MAECSTRPSNVADQGQPSDHEADQGNSAYGWNSMAGMHATLSMFAQASTGATDLTTHGTGWVGSGGRDETVSVSCGAGDFVS